MDMGDGGSRVAQAPPETGRRGGLLFVVQPAEGAAALLGNPGCPDARGLVPLHLGSVVWPQ